MTKTKIYYLKHPSDTREVENEINEYLDKGWEVESTDLASENTHSVIVYVLKKGDPSPVFNSMIHIKTNEYALGRVISLHLAKGWELHGTATTTGMPTMGYKGSQYLVHTLLHTRHSTPSLILLSCVTSITPCTPHTNRYPTG